MRGRGGSPTCRRTGRRGVDAGRRGAAQRRPAAGSPKSAKKLDRLPAQAERRWARVSAAGDADARGTLVRGAEICLVIDEPTREFHWAIPRRRAPRACSAAPRRVPAAHDCNPEGSLRLARPSCSPVVPGSGLRRAGRPGPHGDAGHELAGRGLGADAPPAAAAPAAPGPLGSWTPGSRRSPRRSPSPRWTPSAPGASGQRLKFHNVPEWQRPLDQVLGPVDPAAEGERPEVYGAGCASSRHRLAGAARLSPNWPAPRPSRSGLSTPAKTTCSRSRTGAWRAFQRAPQTTLAHRPGDEVRRRGARSGDLSATVTRSGCQLVFCDLFTPRESSGRRRVAAARRRRRRRNSSRSRGSTGSSATRSSPPGCLPGEVAYVHDASTDEERTALFAAANAGP